MAGAVPVKKFISQNEIEEKRKKRQEEWEKVRQPHQPIEAPEEVVDTRSLYEQLEAQKEQKQLDYEEQHRMKNQVRGLDKEETDFLDFVSERQQELEKAKNLEEHEVLQELRNSLTARQNVAESVSPQVLDKANEKAHGSSAKKRSSQADLLMGAVKRKKSSDAVDKSAEVLSEDKKPSTIGSYQTQSTSESSAAKQKMITSNSTALPEVDSSRVARVIGVLPGLGVYTDSEDSDTSSSDSDIDTDLLRHNQISQKVNNTSGGSCSSSASTQRR